MSFLTYTASVSIDSKSIILKNTTTLVAYHTAIPSIVTESDVVAATTAINLSLTDSLESILVSGSILTHELDLRTGPGASILVSELNGNDALASIEDELYVVTIVDTISSVDYTTTLQLLVYQTVKNQVAVAVISGDWKDSFNYLSKSSYSKYALKLKGWLDQMILANANGLYAEAKTILDSLKSVL